MARRKKLVRYLGYALAATLLALAAFAVHLDFRVRSEFEGRRPACSSSGRA